MARTSVVNPGNSINDQVPAAPRKRSKFSLPYLQYGTSRFGEVGVAYVADTVPGDEFRNINRSKIDTLTYKAPLDDAIRHRRDFFHVPYSAIIPRTWERFISQPNRGDDIPEDAGTGVSWTATQSGYFVYIMNRMYSTYCGSSYKTDPFHGFAMLLCFEMFFSPGCLLNELGFPLMRYCVVQDKDSWGVWNQIDKTLDDFIDEFVQCWIDNVYSITLRKFGSTTETYTYYLNPGSQADVDRLNMRDMLQDMRDGILDMNYASISYLEGKGSNDLKASIEAWMKYDSDASTYKRQLNVNSIPAGKFNFARLFAYQLCVAHYYTNDNVDNVYSANLYRENLKAFIDLMATNNSSIGITKEYTWNGVQMVYEPCSAHYLKQVLFDSNYVAFNRAYIYQFLTMIFSHRYSLKYVDFFTGLRTSPLAVGNTNIQVSGGYVNVVDVTRSILLQRFLNSVNRSGRKISNYIGELFGVSVRKDICDPGFLMHYDDTIGATTTENTGAAQLTDAQTQTSRLVGGGRFQVDFTCDSFGILIGLSYYDYVRKYAYSVDTQLRKSDRFDLFNPYLENSGDQAVRAEDIDGVLNAGNFGYQQRYMEYKQTFPRATGGFVNNLPGFAFICKAAPRFNFINPIDIRSRNRELDDYYLSLTGYSLGNYFHFINRNESDCEVSRDMSTDAQIL